MKIALDAIGGDFAPDQVVAGGVAAQRELGVDVIFVGPRDQVEKALQAAGAGKWAVLEDAPEVIAMDEHPAQAVRAKRASSIVRGVQMVADGRANAFVSAGNSGAVMAAALFGLQRIRGIDRPALITPLPTSTGKNCYLLDVGANTDPRPEHLLQFALMGSLYVERVMGIPKPRVGLLSIGEEPEKGNQLIRETEPLFRQSAALNFIGNVEGKDIFRGKADVIVTDAFSGNVLIKTAEGVAEFLFRSIRDALRADPLSALGGILARHRLLTIRKRADWREFGGAPLLGVRGVAVVAHGRSDARAVRSSIRVARDAVAQNITQSIADAAGSSSVPSSLT